MGTFCTKKEDLANFFHTPHVDKQEGVYFAYATDMEALQKVVPPHLTVVGPFVIGYVVKISAPNFGEEYMESALGVPVTYGETMGLYAFNLMLEGPGALMGIFGGREADGIPKKLADSILVERNENQVAASITRKGVKLLDFNMELGSYNDPNVKMLFGEEPEGLTSLGNTFLYKYDLAQREDGSCEFFNGSLNTLIMETKNEQWTPGTAEITVTSSIDDPFGELPVVKVLGGAYIKHDVVIMKSLKKLQEVDALEALQYQFAGRYDQSMLVGPEKR